MNSLERQNKLLEIAAHSIVNRGLTTPAIFILEMLKPLSGFMCNFLFIMYPVLNIFLGFKSSREYMQLFTASENVEHLIKLLEKKFVSEDNNHKRVSAE